MDRIRHLGEGASLRRRADDSKPWWCYWYPAACETPTGGGGQNNRPTTTRRQTSTSTSKTRTTSKTSTSRTTAPQTTKATPPPATQPAATPPAATPTAKTSAQPAPAPAPVPSPSPTAQPTTSAPMAVPPATDTGTPDAQSTSVDPVVVQPNESSSDSPENGNGADPTPTQTGDSAGSGQTTGGVNASPTGSSGDESQSGDRSGPPSVVAPSPSTSGAGATTGVPWPTVGSAGPGGGTSGGGLPPGAIAGLVVGLLFLLALLALLLYRFRRTAAVQRMLAPFGNRGGGAGAFHRVVDTPGGDGMSRTLLTPAPGVTATAASHHHHYGRSLTSHPPMGQTGHLHHPAAAATRDSNRVSVFTNGSGASTGAFTPSPVSPVSPTNGMLSPGTVRSSRPMQEPPDPRIVTAANAHVSRGSVSSISTGSAISAALSPGQMAWPMPPGTPPVIRHPDGPRYLNFEQSGETVVRISQPPRNRRSGGY